MKNRVMYLTLGNRRVGCVAMVVDRKLSLVRYAVSVCHDSDKFDRVVAQSVAATHLNDGGREVTLSPYATGHEISVAVLRNLSRNSSAPTKARQAADKWLRQARTKSATVTS